MQDYTLDHVHLNSITPFETAQWFADNFGAEVINPWTDDKGIAHIDVNVKGGGSIFVMGPTTCSSSCCSASKRSPTARRARLELEATSRVARASQEWS